MSGIFQSLINSHIRVWNQCTCLYLQLLAFWQINALSVTSTSDFFPAYNWLIAFPCFCVFTLEQKPQARSALLQAAESDFSVKLFVAEYNKTDRKHEGENRGIEVKRVWVQNKERTTSRTITQHLPTVGSLCPNTWFICLLSKYITAIIFFWHYQKAIFTVSSSLPQHIIIPFPLSLTLPWPYHCSSLSHWRRTRESMKTKWVSSFWAAHDHYSEVMRVPTTQSGVNELKIVKQQTGEQTFRNAWNWITAKSHPTNKEPGERHILSCPIPVPKRNKGYRVLLFVTVTVSLQKKPTALSTAKSNCWGDGCFDT